MRMTEDSPVARDRGCPPRSYRAFPWGRPAGLLGAWHLCPITLWLHVLCREKHLLTKEAPPTSLPSPLGFGFFFPIHVLILQGSSRT